MRKMILFVLALLIIASPAWALQCKTSQSGQSDECWTTVRVSNLETTAVIPGMLLVYDFTDDNVDDAAFQVRVSTASEDGYKVAGVAQSVIATGDQGAILVRGKGKLRVAGGNASGDRLYPSTTAGSAGRHGPGGVLASHDALVAFALAANTGAATTDAYIIVV